MRPWQFRQKTPGFGISRNFYLPVLAATAQLPRPLDIANPEGANSAVQGFSVPLSQSAHKEDLSRPLERGMYGIASKNKQTVLRLVVIPKEEAGFDPAPFLRSPEAHLLSQEHLSRISATWTLLQLTFETHESAVYPSLKFIQSVAQRLALLTGGVVSDPISRSYWLPEEVFHKPALNEHIDVRDFVRVRQGSEEGHFYTLGLQKFGLPEYEIFGVPAREQLRAEQFLLGIGQSALLGQLPKPGDVLGARSSPFQVATGGLNRKQWEGIECYELLPPSGVSPDQALEAWAAEILRQ